MRIGGSLFLIAVGAILKWAITDHVSNVNLATVGTILMVVGAVGLVLTLIMLSLRRRPEVVRESRHRYVDEGPVAGSSRTTYVTPESRDPLE
jgi:beta-lactamase regulating signal transducer with metallopeptidase domain